MGARLLLYSSTQSSVLKASSAKVLLEALSSFRYRPSRLAVSADVYTASIWVESEMVSVISLSVRILGASFLR